MTDEPPAVPAVTSKRARRADLAAIAKAQRSRADGAGAVPDAADLAANTRAAARTNALLTFALALPFVVMLAAIVNALPNPLAQVYAVTIAFFVAACAAALVFMRGQGAVEATIITRTRGKVVTYARPNAQGLIVTKWGAYITDPKSAKLGRFALLGGAGRMGSCYLYFEGNPNPIDFSTEGSAAVDRDSYAVKAAVQSRIIEKLHEVAGDKFSTKTLVVIAVALGLVASGVSYWGFTQAKQAISDLQDEIASMRDGNGGGVFAPPPALPTGNAAEDRRNLANPLAGGG